MKNSARPIRQPTSRHLAKIRCILGLCAAMAAASTLSACATGPTFAEQGDPAGSDIWEGAKPKPMSMTSSSPARIGSQPLLPPVPEETNGLAPIRMSSLVD